jgi:hypothetical protein
MNKYLLLALLSLFPAGALVADEWGNDSGDDWGDDWQQEANPWFHGFVEVGYSAWLDSNPNYRDRPLEEIRWRLERDDQWQLFKTSLVADIYHDAVIDDSSARFREINLSFSPTQSSDLKLGRQILTWGTGDLLFINDLFPKDWQAFFSGRDDEYLKAPSDAIKWSFYGRAVNLDVVLTPEFDSDEYLNGERFSFYLPGGIQQPASPLSAEPNSDDDWELALRLHGVESGKEWAVYGYRGFFKSPNAMDMNGNLLHSRLDSLGASLRMPLAGGLWNLEGAYYYSVDDRDGTDPLISNSEIRLLTGYERELVKNLTASGQLYIEKTQHYDRQQAFHPQPQFNRSEWYELLTFRLTHLAFQQNLVSSAFVFYSPDEEDWHLRLKADYRIDDHWKVSAGVYGFGGDDDYSFFGQLQENDSVWMRVRYSY